MGCLADSRDALNSVLPFVLRSMELLAPSRDHHLLGEAIARRVDAELPLFADDEDRKKTAATMVSVAFRESSLRADIVGDFRNGKPTSFCAYQINETMGGSSKLLTDVDACVARGLTLLRESARICRAHPIAWYAEGPRGCDSPRAQRISRDRLAIAQRLVREVRP